jgi:hypothetical protein
LGTGGKRRRMATGIFRSATPVPEIEQQTKKSFRKNADFS